MVDSRYDSHLVHLGGDLNLLEKCRLAGWDLSSVIADELSRGFGVRNGWNLYTMETRRFYSPAAAARLMWSNFPGFVYLEETLTIKAISRAAAVGEALTELAKW